MIEHPQSPARIGGFETSSEEVQPRKPSSHRRQSQRSNKPTCNDKRIVHERSLARIHHAQFLVPLAEKANAHLEHPLVYVLGELLDIRIAEFRAGKNRARSAAQLGFWRQFAIQFLPWHLHDPT